MNDLKRDIEETRRDAERTRKEAERIKRQTDTAVMCFTSNICIFNKWVCFFFNVFPYCPCSIKQHLSRILFNRFYESIYVIYWHFIYLKTYIFNSVPWNLTIHLKYVIKYFHNSKGKWLVVLVEIIKIQNYGKYS